MNTSEITSFVKKYYLDGQCDSAIWNQSPTGYKVNFFTATKDCLGEIEFNTAVEDGETKFGVFSTSQLLSLMTITDEFCTLSLERDPKGNPMKLQISDNQLLKCIIISFFVERPLKCGKKRSKTAILFV